MVGELGEWFEKTRHEGVRVLGPAAAPIVRLKQDYRYHFVLKSPSREKLNALLRAMLGYAAQQKNSANTGDCGCGRGVADVENKTPGRRPGAHEQKILRDYLPAIAG